MSSIFGGKKPAKTADEIEADRAQAERLKELEREKEEQEAKEVEELSARRRRLRGSRALFTAGVTGFADEKSENLGGK